MNILQNFKEVSRSCLTECVYSLQQTDSSHDVIVVILESFILAGSQFLGQDAGLHNAIRIAEESLCELVPDTLPVKHTGRGRPAIYVDLQTVEHLLSMNFRGIEIAGMLGISITTLFNKLRAINYSVKDSYSTITRDDLGAAVNSILMEVPNTGYKRMRGYLLQRGIKVPELRVREIMRVVDPNGVFQRTGENRAIVRRAYFVRFSDDLWHIDTNLKLGTWKIVVIGGIDGKSRVCTYLEAGSYDTSESNFSAFRNATQQYGIPNRCRSDKGGENIFVTRFMLEARGTGRGSHICGRSVHNQRIERFWRDVFYGCMGFYKRVFLTLKEDGILWLDSELDLFSLHYIMLLWDIGDLISYRGVKFR